ncbi:AbgT family transporter, partial [Aquisalimonas sp.]|uniref:AbgT family transporter n=1 Tax=Aquisalimonas sp. TaxID=1872621 RepID=UPI0025BBA752
AAADAGGASGGVLGWIERMGNKLPHPFWLFVWICIVVVVVSAVATWWQVSATHPDTGDLVAARSLLSGDGLRWFLEEMVTNFAHFAPFGLVLVMLMGVSVAERSGLLAVVMRTIAFSVPRKIVLPVIFIIGACGNIGSDAGIVVVPPIAALIFVQMGLNPIVTATIALTSLSQPAVFGLAPELLALSVMTGWALAVGMAPLTTSVLITARVADVPATTVGYRWNGWFTVGTAVLASGWLLVLGWVIG